MPGELKKSSAKGAALTAVLIAAVLCVFWIVQGTLVYRQAREHDFLAFYTGALLIRSGQAGDLYDVDLQLETQQRLLPHARDVMPFIRPSYYAAMLSPLALLSHGAAFWVWLGFQTALLMLCCAWAVGRFGWDALIFASLYFPTAAGITHGQDCVWMLAAVIGCYALAERDKDLAAGAVLGLGLVKFHLLLLAPLAMLLAGRRRMFAGYCLTGAAALASFFLLSGVTGFEEYAELLQRDDIKWLSPAPQLMVNIHGIAANAGWDSALLRGSAAAAVAAAAVWGARQAPLWLWFSLAVTGSLLIVPHAYAYDAAMLLLPLWLALFGAASRWTKIAAVVLIVPLPFYSFMAGPPWSVLPAIAVTAFFVALLWEARAARSSASSPAVIPP